MPCKATSKLFPKRRLEIDYNLIKKRDRFRRGLNTKLKERLNLVQPDTYNELVNMAITQEDCIAVHRAEKKRKAPTGPSNAQPPRYRLL